jgi:hypothetical protein
MKTKSAKPDRPPPSAAVVCSWFAPCGPPEYHHLRDAFRTLPTDIKRAVVEDIQNGFDPADTIANYTDGKPTRTRKRKPKNDDRNT